MQKAVLCLLPSLAPVDAPALWPDYLSALLDLLRPEQLAAATPDAAPGRVCEEGVGGDRCVSTWHAPPSDAMGVQLYMLAMSSVCLLSKDITSEVCLGVLVELSESCTRNHAPQRPILPLQSHTSVIKKATATHI